MGRTKLFGAVGEDGCIFLRCHQRRRNGPQQNRRGSGQSMRKGRSDWKIGWILTVWMFLPGGAFASGGQRPNAYMEYGVGGAQEAMAGAAAGLRDDPSCGFWNPAGLTGIKNIQIEAQNSFLSLS